LAAYGYVPSAMNASPPAIGRSVRVEGLVRTLNDREAATP